ncbi:hypothetical protein LCER1_G007708 [Lachnellula cervina]|uniref:Uncharacterized protein n=1 Tax=Lachnellula cervina TaxID=1316786 RepID=A0A7D8UMY7_9HELO|nr:hypothetical protein LCER1_G007708 [Lachnellula cervina]
MSGAINKVKDALHLNKDQTTTTHTTTTHSGVPEGTAGPHSSRVGNAADPRVDSDLDSTRHTGVGHTGTGTGAGVGHTGVGHTGTTHPTHTTGAHSGTGIGSSNHGSTTVGPHSSDTANKLDPRVDSDLSKTHNTTHGTSGLTGSTGTHTTHGTTGLTGSHNTAGTHTTHGTTGLDGTHGNHGLGGTHAGNTSGTHTGTTGGISHSTNAGPHNSNLANKADPRVDSDLDGRGNRHGASTGASAGVFGASGSHATAGSGTAQNTAGPHNSDALNKIDPVSLPSSTSPLKTLLLTPYSVSTQTEMVPRPLAATRPTRECLFHRGTATTHRDVHDASQVPPSVFAAHQGEAVISDDRTRRHSVVSHQEKLSGV